MVANSMGLYLSGNREINMMMITTKYYPLSQKRANFGKLSFRQARIDFDNFHQTS